MVLSLLLVWAPVRCGLLVDPIFLGVTHSLASRHLAQRTRFVESAGLGAITEGLCSVASYSRVPLINNHLSRHEASPNTSRTFGLVSSRSEPPMTALPIHRESLRNA